ncbi:oxidoreductase [Chitinophaga filiformis]|uniref:Oxidoreductase n=1 Tax=Chitinophaga filiformis TaxID=104663 RepID=A0ABY4I8L6_CHIFI|nr:oxidoreductase [Chitinophaga filiformis]UPK72438.1 oxidoreductase [Chitinophaga filiformis]
MKTQKVWFITGASKGFGLEIAKAALTAGDKVVATVRSNPEQLRALLGNEHDALVVTLDVTREDQVKQGVQDAISKFGRVDVLVNNAGYGLLGATEEVSDQEVRKQYDTNVFGLLNVTRAILPHMRSQKNGHIINISSLLGYTASVPGFGLYGSTKFAVEGITEGLALEVKPLGIHVTTAAPGYFRTKFASTESYQAAGNIIDAYKDTVGHVREFISQIDGNQPGDPIRLAQVILKLAASENPPIHLPLGSDAVAAFRTKAVQAGKEVDEWESISSSTDYPKD